MSVQRSAYQRTKRVVCVLGMHRSGTSAITRMLKPLGVELGSDLLPPVHYNPRGLWEDRTVVAINHRLLAGFGSNFDSLMLGRIDMQHPALRGLLEHSTRHLLRILQSPAICGIKDPRFCLTLPFWRASFSRAGCDDAYVVCIRHPLSVAESLADRDGLQPELSLLLWGLHTFSALMLTVDRPHVLVDYDEMMNEPLAMVRRMASALVLPKPDEVATRALASDFLNDSLRHWHHEWTEEVDQVSPSYTRRLHGFHVYMATMSRSARPPDFPLDLLEELRQLSLDSLKRYFRRLPGSTPPRPDNNKS